MNFKELVNIQQQFDKEHGWNTNSKTIKEFIENINSDIVGLIGEIGEFSNVIKKIRLDALSNNTDSRKKYESILHEELIDIFIYFIRLSTYFNIDIEHEYSIKLYKNINRFKQYENNDDKI
jgi:NTP pyrophosphatase (non-canonical NTP hydrolase)